MVLTSIVNILTYGEKAREKTTLSIVSFKRKRELMYIWLFKQTCKHILALMILVWHIEICWRYWTKIRRLFLRYTNKMYTDSVKAFWFRAIGYVEFKPNFSYQKWIHKITKSAIVGYMFMCICEHSMYYTITYILWKNLKALEVNFLSTCCKELA